MPSVSFPFVRFLGHHDDSLRICNFAASFATFVQHDDFSSLRFVFHICRRCSLPTFLTYCRAVVFRYATILVSTVSFSPLQNRLVAA